MSTKKKTKDTRILQEVSGYRGSVLISKKTAITKRIMVGIPMTGNVRGEWMMARYGQIIPCNWSQMELIQWLDQSSPLRFQVADARNVLASDCVERGFEWLIFIDHDVILPPIFLTIANERMIHDPMPMWSGLYFTKSVPAEPLIYRGRGTSYYANWKLGDKVWCDGHGMGCTVIHGEVLKVLYDTSEEYNCFGRTVRRIFDTPSRIFWDPEGKHWHAAGGTEDLEFCSRIMREDVLKKAGWAKYARKKYPFLVDTAAFCWHINPDGTRYPAKNEHFGYMPKDGKVFRDEWVEGDGK